MIYRDNSEPTNIDESEDDNECESEMQSYYNSNQEINSLSNDDDDNDEAALIDDCQISGQPHKGYDLFIPIYIEQ